MAYNPQNPNGQAVMASSAPVVIASNQSAVAVDTELTAPAALADATANPTISNLASLLMGYNGTTWDRLRATTARGLQVQTENPASAAAADALANPTISQVGADGMLFNGTTWDRARGNGSVQVQASTAKTATFQSATQTNFNWRGVILTFNITAVSGTTPTMTLAIESLDPGSGTLWTPLLTSTSISTVSVYRMFIYPGYTAAANVAINSPLPRSWRVNATIGGGTPSFTFSIGAEYVL